MFKNRFLADVSISTVQVILNQLTGIVVFFIITGYLDKASLGHINWAMALLTVVLSVLGFGLEHIAVRKSATGEDIGALLQSYLVHTIIASAILLLLVWLAGFRFAWLRDDGDFFFWLTLAQCIGFIAIPFRHIANGLEKFSAYFLMSSAGNMLKLVVLLVLASWHAVGVRTVVLVYLFASIAELLVCVLVYRIRLALPLRFGFDRKAYLLLIKEAIPQLGITVFNTAMARMDWVLLGLLSSAVMVADYSVTNKIFELCTLPLLIIAPVVFPKIARMFGGDAAKTALMEMDHLKMLLRLQIIVSVYIAMAINLCWKEVLDPLTSNRYGASTVSIIFIMSFAMPLLYINHIFWSILFAQQRMRKLLLVFLSSFLVNLIADLLLIPYFQANGAAMGYLLALLVQSIMYTLFVQVSAVRKAALQLIPTVLGAVVCGFIADRLFDFFVWKLAVATTGYFLILALMGQLRSLHWQQAKKLLAI